MSYLNSTAHLMLARESTLQMLDTISSPRCVAKKIRQVGLLSHLKHSSRQREAWPGLELMLKACNEEVEKHYRAPNNAAFNLFSQRCSLTCLASIAFQVYA